PYANSMAEEFALHALDLGVRKMALLCPVTWQAGLERYDRLFDCSPAASRCGFGTSSRDLRRGAAMIRWPRRPAEWPTTPGMSSTVPTMGRRRSSAGYDAANRRDALFSRISLTPWPMPVLASFAAGRG